jgi:hypothetical protein
MWCEFDFFIDFMFGSQVLLFQNALTFQIVIAQSYSQQTIKLQVTFICCELGLFAKLL